MVKGAAGSFFRDRALCKCANLVKAENKAKAGKSPPRADRRRAAASRACGTVHMESSVEIQLHPLGEAWKTQKKTFSQ